MGSINPNTTSNGNEFAKTAVQLCSMTLSANPVKDIENLMPDWKIVWNGIETAVANYAFIAVDKPGENYVLAIRGSVPDDGTFSDWDVFANWVLEDLGVGTQASWLYASTPQARISTGAFLGFMSMLDMKDSLGSGLSITDYLLANITGKGKKLTITGHSLGGNIANVYSSFYVQLLMQQGRPTDNISLYTFAAPAAGNADFATDLDAKLPAAWHYHNINDIVPNFPVFDRLVFTSLMYLPQPLAAEITVNYNGSTVTLREAFLMLAGAFQQLGYQQPTNNYTFFSTDLDTDFESNTVGDWFGQAGIQHQLFNYANYLGVKLPVTKAQTTFIQAV